MRRLTLLILFLPAIAAAQAPVIESGGVQNAASNMTLTYVAPQMLVAIKGQNLATSTEIASGWPLPLTLGGASVTLGGVEAPLLYASPTQINAQAPSAVQNGFFAEQTTLVVTTASGSSAPLALPVNTPALGIFTQDATGCGQAVAFNVHPDGSIALNTPQNSLDSQKDLGLAFFLTGLGDFADRVDGTPWTYNPADNELAAYSVIPLLGYPLLTNERLLPPQYIGPAPGTAGVDQINGLNPVYAAQGCHIPMFLQYNQGPVASQLVDVSIQPGGGACADPPDGTLGIVSWQQNTVSDTAGTSTTAAITAQFIQSNGLGFAPPGPPQSQESAGPLQAVPAACEVSLPTTLNAGNLTLTGPGFTSAPLTAANGPRTIYQAVLPGAAIQGGAYQVNGSGGAQVGAFTASGQIPAPITISSNLAPGTKLGTYNFTWAGGDDSIVTLQFIMNGSYQFMASISASAGSISISPEEPGFGGPGCIGPCIGPIPTGQNIELIFTQAPTEAPSLPFSAQGLGMGGELTWNYVFDFRGLTN
jgi:uncharacterized protein (TIGR03437 family)